MKSMMKSMSFTKMLSLLVLSYFMLMMCILYWFILNAMPMSDDFYFANIQREQGVLSGAYHLYMTWIGRWSAMILSLALNRFDLIHYYGFLMLLLNAGVFISLCFMMRCFRFSWFNALFLASALNVWMFLSVFDTGESFFWLPGVIGNTLGIALNMAFLAYVFQDVMRQVSLRLTAVEQTAKKRLGRMLKLLVLMLVSFALPALHEVYAAYVLGVMFCMLILVIIERRLKIIDQKILFISTLCYLLGLISVVAAPGNYARLETVKSSNEGEAHAEVVHSIIDSLLIAFDHHVMGVLLNPLSWCVIILVLVLSKKTRGLSTLISKFKHARWLIVVTCLGSITVLSMSPFLITQFIGVQYPARVSGAISMLIIINMILITHIFARDVLRALTRFQRSACKLHQRSMVTNVLYVSLLFLLLLHVIVTPRYLAIGRDLSGSDNIHAWRSWYVARHEMIRESGKNDVKQVILTPPIKEPELYYGADLRPSHKNKQNQWRFELLEIYYGVDEIIFTEDKTEHHP